MNLGVPAHQMPDIAVLTAPPVSKFIPWVWAGGLYFPCYKTKEVIRTIPFWGLKASVDPGPIS